MSGGRWGGVGVGVGRGLRLHPLHLKTDQIPQLRQNVQQSASLQMPAVLRTSPTAPSVELRNGVEFCNVICGVCLYNIVMQLHYATYVISRMT